MRANIHRYARAFGLAGTVLVLGTGLAACSAGSHNASSSQGTAPGARAPAQADQGNTGQDNAAQGNAAQGNAAQGGGAAQRGAVAGGGAKPQQVSGAANARSIVYTGSITVQVSNVDSAADSLAATAATAGGFVGGDTRKIDNDNPSATVTLRVPADQFESVVNTIGRLGHEQARQISTEDVTGQVIDLDARIQAQQASVDRVRELLGKAQSLSDITSIESQLTQRESDLESLQAQQRRLSDLTSLSTITVTLVEPAAVAAPAPKHDSPGGFLGGLRSGWHAFVAVMGVLLTVLGALLPFILVIGVPAAALLWILRRRTRPSPAAPVPAVPTDPTS